jgi:membrane fusion protein (multidrug efflux system)
MRAYLVIAVIAAAAFCSPLRAGEYWRGVFEPRAQAVLPSEVAMPVAALPKKPGETCAAGDVLVEFDSTIAHAALDAAEARLDAAVLKYEGQENLFRRDQATEAELAGAASELGRARLDEVTARRELAACRVVAPFAGRIVDHRVREFEWAGKGAPLLLLVDDSVLTARFFLPEEYFPKIAVGDAVTASVPSAGLSVRGVVSRLGAVFDPASRTFDVWAEVDNERGLLRAGMTAEVLWSPEETRNGR